MTRRLKSLLTAFGIDARKLYQRVSAASIEAALLEQDLLTLRDRLREIVPDVSDQYSGGFESEEFRRYWEPKMRGLHAFQVCCLADALDHLGGDHLTIVDIGDSSGNHARYIKALKPDRVGHVISVNSDPVAVEKIRCGGGEAIASRAESLDLDEIRPDLVVSFETVEHLTDPVRFLHRLAISRTSAPLLLTVPYLRSSRFGGDLLRLPADRLPDVLTPEVVHIFELSLDDWTLLARFAGFEPTFRRIYRQYPVRGLARATAPLWRKHDFEGFCGLFLRADRTLADRYTGW